MPKKNMTPEERKAFGEKMKAARAAKSTEKQETPDVAQYTPPVEKEEQILSNEEARDLLRRVKELESNFARGAVKADYYQNKPEVDRQGSLVGSFEKYILSPAHYPDPTERLSHEHRLQQFAFPTNYELKFDVSTTAYQNQDGVNVREPRFSLKLIKIVIDDQGNQTNERYELRTMLFHEDPDTALTIAQEQGIEVGTDQKAFLDEMRYLRMRDTLLEWFYPRPASPETKRNERVEDNQVVQVYEVSSTDTAHIPFDKIGKLSL